MEEQIAMHVDSNMQMANNAVQEIKRIAYNKEPEEVLDKLDMLEKIVQNTKSSINEYI